MATSLRTEPTRPAANGSAPAGLQLVQPRQRKVSWIVLGVMLVGGAAIGFGAWGAEVGRRVPVLAAAHDIAPGAAIERSDLRVVRVASDAGVPTLPDAQLSATIGRRAGSAIPKGTLLHAALLSDGPAVAAGEAVVGVALAPGAVPTDELKVGDRVQVVATSSANPSDEERTGVIATAVVFGLRELDDAARTTVVSLRLQASSAADVADAAGAGRVRLVLVGEES